MKTYIFVLGLNLLLIVGGVVAYRTLKTAYQPVGADYDVR